MEHHKSWISLIGFCLMTALASALVFAIIVAGGSVALASHQEEVQKLQSAQSEAPVAPQHFDESTFSGLITDSYCGARHMRHSNLTPAECAALCLRTGAAYVLVDGDHTYKLSGAKQYLQKLLGTRARVSGRLEGDTIKASSAEPLDQ